HKDMIKYVYDKGQGSGKKTEIGEVLYNRGLAAALVTVEAVKRAQIRYGKKPLTGEQVRWGLENMALDDAAIKKLGFDGFMVPVSTSCVNHSGEAQSRIHTWDGKRWVLGKDVYRADNSIITPMIRASAAKYAAEKKVAKRDCAKESQQ
ncbi:MAG: ABC transporter permease, partial [Burkholderiales bacterium]